MKDNINPSHYQSGDVECWEAIRAAIGSEGWIMHCRGTAIKYIYRCGSKDSRKQELSKAAWYINKAIEELSDD